MDKETLSNYGWIVICVMVMAVMLALATPFGSYIAGAIQSTTQGLFDVNQNALDSAGIEIMEQEFEEMLNGPSATDSPVKFGQPYQITMDGMLMEYVFYADGSATMWMGDAIGGYMPAGSSTYTTTEVIMGEDPLSISADGTTLYDPEDETLVMTLKSVTTSKLKSGTYTLDPNGFLGLGVAIDIEISADGSVTLYYNGMESGTIPASTITWCDNHFVISKEGQEDIICAIYPDSSKITYGDYVCVIGCSHENTTMGQSKDATCTEAGYTNEIICNDCGKVFPGESVPARGHDYNEEVVQEWSCTTAQITKFTCTVCSHSYEKTVAPYHTYDENSYICKVCGYENVTDYSLNSIDDYKRKTGIDISSGDVVLPEIFQTQDGTWYRITTIGTQVFDDCTELTSIVIPSSVTTIKHAAFRDSGLRSVTLPYGLTTISTSVFDGCEFLTNVTIPNSVTSIGANAFENCYSLTNIVIPDSVTSLGGAAFMCCKNLTSVTISKNITEIKHHTFSHCAKLTNVVIPDGVTSIGPSAFSGGGSVNQEPYPWNDLTSITIPASVTSIGDSAFYGCSKLSTINFKGTVEQWKAITLGTDWGGSYYPGSAIPATEIICSDGTVSLS